jgi:hypothetical protein
MRKTVRNKRGDTVFVLIIFCIFAVSVLLVLMLGASTYQNMTEISRESQTERTVLSYIRTKVKNDDDAGKVYIVDFHGLSALCFEEELGGVSYRTLIYHYDGWVYELFSESEIDLSPDTGVRVIRIDDLTFEKQEHGLLKVSAGDMDLFISPRGRLAENIPGGLTG